MKCTKCKNFEWCPTRRGFFCFSFKRKESGAMTDKEMFIGGMKLLFICCLLIWAYILKAGPI